MTPILRDLKTTGGGEPAGAPELFTNRNTGRRPRKKEMAGSQHKLLKRLETDKERSNQIQSVLFGQLGRI
jgi:hypothetical protein